MRTRGFTLIELMIVIAVLGIIAAIAIPAYARYTHKKCVEAGRSDCGPAPAPPVDRYAPREVCVAGYVFVEHGGGYASTPKAMIQLIDNNGHGVPCSTQPKVEK